MIAIERTAYRAFFLPILQVAGGRRMTEGRAVSGYLGKVALYQR